MTLLLTIITTILAIGILACGAGMIYLGIRRNDLLGAVIGAAFIIFALVIFAMVASNQNEGRDQRALRDRVERVATLEELSHAQLGYFAADLENLAMVSDPEVLAMPANFEIRLIGAESSYTVIGKLVGENGGYDASFTMIVRGGKTVAFCDAGSDAGCEDGHWSPEVETTGYAPHTDD